MVDALQILLLSAYELGHQPMGLAWPQAALRAAGFEVAVADLSVDSFPQELAQNADVIAISTPMHTALRLGLDAAKQARDLNPKATIGMFGLYAALNERYLIDVAQLDFVIGGEVEPQLVRLAQQISAAAPLASYTPIQLDRWAYPQPDRAGLQPLSEYAHLTIDGIAYQAGYTEATRGCLHTCSHCPVVPVYGGRFFAVPAENVLTDIDGQVAAGARHITFGDPDFLNGPTHARRVARELHARHPDLTFDFTTKVEHILKHPALITELADLGAVFAVSAFEATSERVLTRLNKGHTLPDMERALAIAAEAGLPIQPTWLPFTPWTELDEYIHMLDWIRAQGLIPATPIVQLSVRLLVPPGSALLADDDREWTGPLDAANFSYAWRHHDPCMDELQQQVAHLAEHAGDDAYANFAEVERLAYRHAGRPAPHWANEFAVAPVPPRLTEDWFC